MARPQRDAQREEPREELREGEFYGREGQIVRRTKYLDDPFNVPDEYKEPGWSYQWNRMTCYGAQDVREMNTMLANGWTYVSPDSPIGRLYHCADKDYIEVDGLVLMERPQGLTDAALEEMRMKTSAQYNGLMSKSSDLVVPKGYKSQGKVARVTGRESFRAGGEISE